MAAAVRIPPAADFFIFDSPSSAHYLTAPSSPKLLFASAPTSPSRSFITGDTPVGSPSAVPFHWEEKPGIPKSPERPAGEDFQFDFSCQLSDKASLSADELFHGGKIKPLRPPPGFHTSEFSSPRSPHSFRASPRHKNEIDPFAAALMKETRGRDRASYFNSSFVRKGTRSLSPLRVSETKTALIAGSAIKANSPRTLKSPVSSSSSSSSSFLSSISFSRGNRKVRKWRLKDLFRSASEGRAAEKDDEMRKYASMLRKKEDDEEKSSSFRSTESGGSRRRGPVSAHEEHYTANRAVSEELKKKSFMPYKQGLLGCLRFHRPGLHEISSGVGSLTRG